MWNQCNLHFSQLWEEESYSVPVFCALLVSVLATTIFLLISGIKSSPQEGRKAIIKLSELKRRAIGSILKLTHVHRMQGGKKGHFYLCC